MTSVRRIKRHSSKLNKKAEYIQVMYLDFDAPSGDHLKAGRKIYRESLPKQKRLNEKRAKRYFEALIEANFKGGKDLHLTLTFRNEDYPEDEITARKRLANFIKALNGKRRRRGIENAKYVTVFETSKTGRFHFHVIMDGLLNRDTVEETWHWGRCNADRLRSDPKEGLQAIVKYLSKGSEGVDERSKFQKRWIPSRGLVRPWISEGKSSISAKRYHKIASLPEDSEMLTSAIEQDNKGYKIQSLEKSYCEQTGKWFIFARMRLKEKSRR